MAIPGARRPIVAFLLLGAMGGPTAAWAETGGGGMPPPSSIAAPVSLLPLSAGPLDYLSGEFDAGPDPASLDLLDASGLAVRRLVDRASGRSRFHLVVPQAGMTLRATGGPALPDALRILQRVDAATLATAPPPPTPPLSSSLLRAAAEALARGEGTQAFWRQVKTLGTPLVEPGDTPDTRLITFLARGARYNATVLGAPTGDHAPMARLGESDIWHASFTVPASTRLAYQIAMDVPRLPDDRGGGPNLALLATARADPFNRFPQPADAPDPYNQDSVVSLPEAPPEPGLAAALRTPPRGVMIEQTWDSPLLGNRRRMSLYLPPGHDPARPDTVILLLFDGRRFLREVPTPAMLDALTAEGTLPPVVAAFLDSPDLPTRNRELPADPALSQSLAEEVLPRVLDASGLSPRPERTVLAGASYGGLAAVRIALDHPALFGNVLSLSGSFWWHPPGTPADRVEHTARRVVALPRQPVRFHLAPGLFEHGFSGLPGILDTNRHLRDLLEAKGYAVSYREYASGHDMAFWRGALADGLMALFGPPKGLP